MRRMHKKTLSVLLAALLLLPVLSACTQKQDYNSSQPSDTICQHAFETSHDEEFRYYSASMHGCYEVEINVCTKCGFTQKEDVGLQYKDFHSLGVLEGSTVTEDGEFILYGLCEYCGARVRIKLY